MGPQGGEQGFSVDRFGDIPIHAGLQAPLFVLGHRVGRGLQLVVRRPVAPLGKVGGIGDREIEARIGQALLHGLRRRLHDVDGHDPRTGPKAIALDVAIRQLACQRIPLDQRDVGLFEAGRQAEPGGADAGADIDDADLTGIGPYRLRRGRQENRVEARAIPPGRLLDLDFTAQKGIHRRQVARHSRHRGRLSATTLITASKLA